MTELEEKIKAKIPGPDTGIEIKHSLCAICSPGHHCGVDCYVKDGKIIRVEGTPEHPYNHGHLCTKGSALRNAVYREDRIRTPLRRVGQRGEGKFEPISWDEAYQTIARKLNEVKEQYGPNSVAFLSGYCKWYRPILHRFAHVFGSVNFGTDDSTCSAAMVIANKVTAGTGADPDMAHANTFLGWNFDGYYSAHLSVLGVQKLKERGGKVIIIDIRQTPASKNLADIFLQINPGTDGALALGMAKLIIDNGWADMDYVEKYTYGFEQYRALADQYPLDKVARITGLDPNDIYEATKLYATNGPACTNFSASALVHHINGFNSHRAIFCLTALTGNFDRAGGNVPNPATYLHKPAGFKMREHEFRSDRYPGGVERIGAERFPLWNAQFDELQGMDLLRQLEEDKPYPVRAIFALGMNAKMYPQTDDLLRAMKDKLDFFVDTDVYMTMTAKYADIVLPACTSVERSELKAYQGGYLFYTKPAIQPLYESRSDVDILCDLARLMNLDDEYLQKGYEASLDWMMEGCGLTVADLKKSDLPVKVPAAKWPAEPGKCLRDGFKTPTGKFEFYSTAIAAIDPKYGLDPLPSYYDSLADQNDEQTRENYPFYLCTGARLAHAIHSRAHETPWLRSLRPEPTCEINPEDGKRLGLKEGGSVELYSPYGSIRVKVKFTHKIKPGVIMMLHGYTEANVNLLIGRDHLDPYSGFPGFKGMRCNIRNVQEG
ncbi:molybdopterin-containing oxidoreductase family protein [Pseudoflavonifractor phocaeensis]|uniref:molybdopterin-containing oxidoreductase family protein n=1 Tax=Pseudoflavonifractor phocaeensis TaxID=1870988 RepID=UPI00195B0AC0|nr:molybdopterin-dependent oxidoreductase [Pseudoflavonifractor phocaeensis]MBM6722605.1 molybdopterin-dependent oxidoreductase [Pseudoflavonifractor phocaeensis]